VLNDRGFCEERAFCCRLPESMDIVRLLGGALLIRTAARHSEARSMITSCPQWDRKDPRIAWSMLAKVFKDEGKIFSSCHSLPMFASGDRLLQRARTVNDRTDMITLGERPVARTPRRLALRFGGMSTEPSPAVH